MFLYREVLHLDLANIDAVRTNRPARIPVVLTPEEVRAITEAMSGTPQLVVKPLYGCGMRLLEVLRLRVQDVDFGMKQVTVRDGKGAKDRYTVLPGRCCLPCRSIWGACAASMRRICKRAWARFICPMPWNASTEAHRATGGGSMSFRHGVCPRTLGRDKFAGIIWMRLRSIKGSKRLSEESA